jgi:hypothetical protein
MTRTGGRSIINTPSTFGLAAHNRSVVYVADPQCRQRQISFHSRRYSGSQERLLFKWRSTDRQRSGEKPLGFFPRDFKRYGGAKVTAAGMYHRG